MQRVRTLEEIKSYANQTDFTISFDFDSTLSKKSVQKEAKNLINDGHKVGICTSRSKECRYTINGEYPKDHNRDIFDVAMSLGIPYDNIVFTDGNSKYEVLSDTKVEIHIDDDEIELELLFEHTDIHGVDVKTKRWFEDINTILTYKPLEY